MTIKELHEYMKIEIEELRKEFKEMFNFFMGNEFHHLSKRVDWLYGFMLTTAVATIGTLIAVIIMLIKQ